MAKGGQLDLRNAHTASSLLSSSSCLSGNGIGLSSTACDGDERNCIGEETDFIGEESGEESGKESGEESDKEIECASNETARLGDKTNGVEEPLDCPDKSPNCFGTKAERIRKDAPCPG